MKIKGLIWKEYDGGQHCAVTTWRCDYWITKPIEGHGAGMYQCSFLDYAGSPWHVLMPTLDAAKSACQSHHEAKVAELLEPMI